MAQRAAVVELPLVPGALSDDTDLAAKLRVVSMDKTRSRGNRWETIKGWTPFHPTGMFPGRARAVHSYATNDGDPIVVAASESAFIAWVSVAGVFTRYDITPRWKDVWLLPSAGKVTHKTAFAPGEVEITFAVYDCATDSSTIIDHNLNIGDVVTFSNVVINTGDIAFAGTFTVTAIPTSTKFMVDCGAGTNIAMTRPFLLTMPMRAGLSNGTGDIISLRPRIPSIDNFGENAVFCFSDGSPVFTFQPTPTATEIITNGTFTGSDTGWDPPVGSGPIWTYNSNTIKSGAGDHTQDLTKKLDGGKIYEMTFQIVAFAGALFRVLIDNVDIFPQVATAPPTPANMVQTYTFRFVCPADPKFLIFRAAATGITIDNVSIMAVTKAVPINEAPQKCCALFVDGNRILNVLGSIEADGDFNAMLLRWCDIDNYREWIPDTDNVAGEMSLGKGSYAVCGAQVGERNLILTDTTAFAASFNNSGYSIRQIGQGCGAIGPNDLGVYNNRAFWASKNSFYSYDGTQVLTIECPVKDQYVGKLERYNYPKMFVWINHEYGEAWFHYPHQDDGVEVSRYLIFNYLEQGNPWSFGTWDRTCMTEAGMLKDPIGLDILDNIWRHEVGSEMPGDIVLPFIETGYVTGPTADRWLGCRRYYPDIENQIGNIRFKITGKRAPQGQNNVQAIGPLLMIPDQAKLDFVLSARQLKFRWESDSSTTNWRLGVVGLEMKADKERR